MVRAGRRRGAIIASLMFGYVVAGACSSAKADTASQLFGLCQPYMQKARIVTGGIIIPPDGAQCWSYFAAVQDFGAIANKGKTYLPMCLPPEGTRDQLIRIFMRYAEAHPELFHEHAAWVVVAAVNGAFPCP